MRINVFRLTRLSRYGELGHGDTVSRRVLSQVKAVAGAAPVGVAAGNEHTVVVTATGRVFAAGYNENGQVPCFW